LASCSRRATSTSNARWRSKCCSRRRGKDFEDAIATQAISTEALLAAAPHPRAPVTETSLFVTADAPPRPGPHHPAQVGTPSAPPSPLLVGLNVAVLVVVVVILLLTL